MKTNLIKEIAMSQDPKSKKVETESTASENKGYYFGGVKEYKLEDIEAEILNDNVYLDVFAGSDARFKTNVESFNGALDALSKIGVYKYQYKTEEFQSQNFPAGEQLGVMAQEIEKIFPDLVKKDDQGFRFVNYAGLSSILLSSVKELSEITTKQTQTIQALEASVKTLEKKLVDK